MTLKKIEIACEIRNIDCNSLSSYNEIFSSDAELANSYTSKELSLILWQVKQAAKKRGEKLDRQYRKFWGI